MDTPGRTRPTRDELRHDVWLAGVLVVAAVLSAALGAVAGMYNQDPAIAAWSVPYALAITAPLALRRRYPITVGIIVSVVYFVATTLRVPDGFVGQIALFIGVYTIGAWVDDRRRATLARWVIISAMFVWLIISTFQAATGPTEDGLSRVGTFSPFMAYMLIQFFFNIAYFGGAYFLGDRAYAAAIQRGALEERTRELEREREVTAAQAVALDRVQIARELHDVVAHHVSAMGVQAGAARTVLGVNPDGAREMMTGIETSARAAIDELHDLLRTLRADGTDDASTGAATGPLSVAPSTLRLSAIDELARHASENGLPTTFTVVGDPIDVPDLVQVNLFRIAQEALTNARKHAGAEATADVRLRYDADAVELEVTNTGHVRATSRAGGLGLIGMRERAAASRGEIEIGPRARGGFLVRARIPLDGAGTVRGASSAAASSTAAPSPAPSSTAASAASDSATSVEESTR